ncbi:Beclin-like protein [Phaffia rhodozyma]|uniref:Beclin-like protein n=1 Tax=Phaffia rhodozyma TaxID=264483 RepID=A0A0F7SN56_PHARH|nr:Beclin-like protein [Phaffia rhodozyma]
MDPTYNCQSCRQPLQLDSSISNIQQSQFELISASLPAQSTPPSSQLSLQDRIAKLNAPDLSKKAYLQTVSTTDTSSSNQPLSSSSSRQPKGPAESFIVLNGNASFPPELSPSVPAPSVTKPSGNRQPVNNPAEKPTKQALITTLLELVSSRADTDHPVCTECARLLQEVLAQRLEEVGFERDNYIAFERQVKEKQTGVGRKTKDEVDALRRELDEATEENEAHATLLALEAETQALQTDLSTLQARSAALLSQELEFHGSHAALADEKDHLVSVATLVQSQYASDLKHLQRLEATNVYSDVFSISVVKGEAGSRIGSINGLRLGKGGGPTPVDWPEINAAWGLALFCLHSLARKANFQFQTYRLVPLGSTSRIEELDGKNVYELYGSSDLALSRFLQNRRYENGMVAFLDCLRQFLEFARKRDSERETVRWGQEKSWDFGRYHIVKEKIGEPSREVSIRSGYVPSSLSVLSPGLGDDSWTRACRYTLLTLHRLIGWTTRDGA